MAGAGVLHNMRISALVWGCCVLIAISGHQAAGSDQRLASFLQTAPVVLRQGGSPVLFVGRIVKVNPDGLPCTIATRRSITYSVETVLFGFAPSRVEVSYPKCGRLETQFSSQDDVLVLAMSSSENFWASQTELMLPATSADRQKAQALLNLDLKNRISRYMRHHGPPHNNRVVVIEGTVRAPIPHSQEPIICKGQPLFSINYDVEQVLRGDWTDKKMVVYFGVCSNPPDPPIRAGERMIVFAYVSQWRSQVYGDLNLLFAPEQMAQVKAALGLH